MQRLLAQPNIIMQLHPAKPHPKFFIFCFFNQFSKEFRNTLVNIVYHTVGFQQPPSQKNSKTIVISFESTDIELFESGNELGVASSWS